MINGVLRRMLHRLGEKKAGILKVAPCMMDEAEQPAQFVVPVAATVKVQAEFPGLVDPAGAQEMTGLTQFLLQAFRIADYAGGRDSRHHFSCSGRLILEYSGKFHYNLSQISATDRNNMKKKTSIRSIVCRGYNRMDRFCRQTVASRFNAARVVARKIQADRENTR
jgi:hypothetical protein